MNPENNIELNRILSEIAARYLGVSTLEIQNSDSLDFHDLGVGNLKMALTAAFNAGYENYHKTKEN